MGDIHATPYQLQSHEWVILGSRPQPSLSWQTSVALMIGTCVGAIEWAVAVSKCHAAEALPFSKCLLGELTWEGFVFTIGACLLIMTFFGNRKLASEHKKTSKGIDEHFENQHERRRANYMSE